MCAQNLVVPPKSSPLQGASSYDPDSSVPAPLYMPRPRPRRHSAPTDIDFPPSPSESSSPSERLSPIASPPPRGRVPVPSKSLQNPRDDYDSSSPSSRAPPRHRATVSELPARFTPHDEDEYSSYSEASPRTPTKVANIRIIEESSPGFSPKVKSPSEFRRIFYTVAEDDGEALAHDDDTFGSFLFKGHSLQELTEALQLETGIDENIILCMRNPLTSKLYKMRLQLPPNKAPLSIVVVRHNSQCTLILSSSSLCNFFSVLVIPFALSKVIYTC